MIIVLPLRTRSPSKSAGLRIFKSSWRRPSTTARCLISSTTAHDDIVEAIGANVTPHKVEAIAKGLTELVKRKRQRPAG